MKNRLTITVIENHEVNECKIFSNISAITFLQIINRLRILNPSYDNILKYLQKWVFQP